MLGASGRGWYDRTPVSLDEFRDAVFESKAVSQRIGMMANIIENHDEPRGVSRYLPECGRDETGKKLLAGISLMSFGLPFLYQGQEIGMTNKHFQSIREVDDINTLDEYKVALEHGFGEEEALQIISGMSRDNARTPMQWSSGIHAGFSSGTPWLAENENYGEINVEEQEGRADSVLSFYKKLIALRTDPEYAMTVVYGLQEPFGRDMADFTGFYRKGTKHTLLVLANCRAKEREVEVLHTVRRVVLNNYVEPADCVRIRPFEGGSRVVMKGWQFLKKKNLPILNLMR